MSEKNLWSMEEQGRRLSGAFAEAESSKRKNRRFRIAAVATAGIAALAIAIFGFAGHEGAGGAFTVDEAVAAVAQAAYDQPTIKSGSVIYSKTRTTNVWSGINHPQLNYKVPAVDTTERWYRDGDKKGWIRWTFERGPSVKSRSLTCHTVIAGMGRPTEPANALHLPRKTEIPTDPKAVYKLIRAHVPAGYMFENADDEVVWQSITYLMNSGAPQLTPQQRAAVIGALAYVDGVETTGLTTDPVGNRAIGFSRQMGSVRARVFFDAETSLTSYEDSVLTRPTKQQHVTVPAGTTMASRALLDYKAVDGYPPLTMTPRKQAGKLEMLCPEMRHQKPK